MALNLLSPAEIKAISFLDSTKSSTPLPKLPGAFALRRRDCGTVIGRRVQCSAAQTPPPAWPGRAVAETSRRTWDGPKPISIVGSTGSIGTQTLDIVAENPDKFRIVALAAGSNVTLLVDQVKRFKPQLVAVGNESLVNELKEALADLDEKPEIIPGEQGVVEVARHPDAVTVVTGIVGCAGLKPTVAAIEAGKDIALANKETLIAGGPFVLPLAHKHNVKILPADSEHSAIFQCIQGLPEGALRRIILTASGGSFRDWPVEKLKDVKVADALKHPNWNMGKKITVDSATLFNKGLEVIEAHYLFGAEYDDIEIVIHPQSIIHSMIETQDSSVLAQLGWPDMRLPILYTMSWPDRIYCSEVTWPRLDLCKLGPPSRVSDLDQPSRADEVDNWAMTKKSLPSVDSGRQNRYSSLGSVGAGGGGGGGVGGGMGGPAWSRADEVDNWAVGKKPTPRSSPFGSEFHSGPEPDRWARGGREVDRVERERPKLVLDPPKAESGVNEPSQVVKTNKPNPFGAARPREEILAEKGLDWKKLESEIEAKKTSRPTSAHSSRPSSAQSSRSEGPGLHASDNVVKPRPKVNPFGDAKPREVLLEERGKDWRKIDLELEHLGIDRPETEEEKILKEEIDHLKKELEKESTNKVNSETVQESGGDRPSLRDIILQKERELEALIREFDDKVRFGQKAIDRPGSGAGRPGSGAGRPGSSAGRAGNFHERTPSYSGSFEDSRSVEYVDRSPLQGKGDPWARPFDDRRSFHGGRERGGFLGSRDMGRARSRERW